MDVRALAAKYICARKWLTGIATGLESHVTPSLGSSQARLRSKTPRSSAPIGLDTHHAVATHRSTMAYRAGGGPRSAAPSVVGRCRTG